jgi:hypothetical protein
MTTSDLPLGRGHNNTVVALLNATVFECSPRILLKNQKQSRLSAPSHLGCKDRLNNESTDVYRGSTRKVESNHD